MQCGYFDAGRCRSCTLMGRTYADQLAEKVARVTSTLAPFAASTTWLEPVTSPESHFRNKAKLVVAGRRGRPTFGILDGRGRGIDLRRCGLHEAGLTATLDPLHRFVAELGIAPYDVPARRGELKHVIVTHSPAGEQLVRFVVRTPASADLVRRHLAELRRLVPSARVVSTNVLAEHKAVLDGDVEDVVTEQSLLPMPLPAATLLLAPRSFFQTNTQVAASLYQQVREWADEVGPGVVHDLYCGVGGFALHLAAPGRHVVGVESSAEAVRAAGEAARRMTPALDGGSVAFVAADATAAVVEPAPDLVVVNPPRRGLGPDLAARLDRSPARHLVYSSCDVDTLARDLGRMPSWRPERGRMADMFPQSRHVEVALLLGRR
ncbi:MAG: methyltransferase [Dermatophilaceae bacterium]